MASLRFSLLCFITVFVFSGGNEATEFVVGGKNNSWRIPSSPNALNSWAEKERFKIGDSLVFKYDSKTDSVLEVEEGDYKKCIKTKPIKEHQDGNTTIPIVESGSFYFISGANGNCVKGEKLEVIVLSHKHTSPPPAQSPQSSPAKSSLATLPPPVLTPAESPKSTSGGSDVGSSGVETKFSCPKSAAGSLSGHRQATTSTPKLRLPLVIVQGTVIFV